MREIKFRAWDKKEKKIVDDFFESWDLVLYQGGNDVGYHLEDDSGEPIKGEWELMQYTGIKDKNGKEIWEGDIIKEFYNGENYEVGFYEGAFYPIPHDVLQETLGEIEECEVIGNKFENKELLK